ncbi:hypothetical protein [Paenibacillus sp. RC67]|uniref:hypothetical protein n=1 Tax=Paenibacillus sp. RC67 TaxID=3039392 RepID=UPI0024AE5C46|nr:hypothetical protein [Paenibacillus sp. RC67]
MTGQKPEPLPNGWIPITDNITVKINGIYVVDTDKLDESPFKCLLDGAERMGEKPFYRTYIFIYTVQWNLEDGEDLELSVLVTILR